jgi:hypothetical protein
LSPRAARVTQLEAVALTVAIAVCLTKSSRPREAGSLKSVAKATGVAHVAVLFLAELDATQISMIWPYIDSEVWMKKFADYVADQEYVKEMLQKAGW